MHELQEKLNELEMQTSIEIEHARLQAEAIQETHKLLQDYTLQVITNLKAIDENEKKINSLASAIIEIRKYSEQELAKYSSRLFSLTGRLQGLQHALALASDNKDDVSESSESKEEKNELASATVTI